MNKMYLIDSKNVMKNYDVIELVGAAGQKLLEDSLKLQKRIFDYLLGVEHLEGIKMESKLEIIEYDNMVFEAILSTKQEDIHLFEGKAQSKQDFVMKNYDNIYSKYSKNLFVCPF